MTQLLYAAKGGSSTTSDLYTINPATGVATPIGPIGFAITGLAMDPTTGILYGATSKNSSASPKCIITINTTTGAGTLVGAQGLPGTNTAADICFNAAGQMYGWGANANGLLSINKATGAATPVGSSSSLGGALSFTSGDVLYHLPFSAALSIDTVVPGTGAETSVATLGAGPGAGGPNAAAFDATDICYVLWNINPAVHLVTINIATGVVTDIGATDNLMDGLAWSVAAPAAPAALSDGKRVGIAFDDGPLEPNPTFTFIDGLYENLVAGYDIHRGKQTLADRTDTGTATVYLNDTQGLFDPANASSPYFGKLDGKQIVLQAWNPIDLEWVPQFTGTIDDYGYDINPATNPDGTLLVANVQIDCVDIFDYLAGYTLTPGLDGDTPPAGSEGVIFYEDTAGNIDDRVIQLLTDASVDSARWVVFTANVSAAETKYDVGEAVLAALRDAADAELPQIANIYCDKIGRFVFHGRESRFDPDTVSAGATPGAWNFMRWKLGDGLAIEADPNRGQMRILAYSRSRSDTVNVATVWPTGMDQKDMPGQVYKDDTAIGAYGKHPLPPIGDLIIKAGTTTGNTAKVECQKYAELIVKNQKDPRERITSLIVKAIRPEDARAAKTWAVLTGADISDIVNLKVGYPGGVGIGDPDGDDNYIEGVTMRVRPLSTVHDYVELELAVSPAEWSMDTHGVFA